MTRKRVWKVDSSQLSGQQGGTVPRYSSANFLACSSVWNLMSARWFLYSFMDWTFPQPANSMGLSSGAPFRMACSRLPGMLEKPPASKWAIPFKMSMAC